MIQVACFFCFCDGVGIKSDGKRLFISPFIFSSTTSNERFLFNTRNLILYINASYGNT